MASTRWKATSPTSLACSSSHRSTARRWRSMTPTRSASSVPTETALPPTTTSSTKSTCPSGRSRTHTRRLQEGMRSLGFDIGPTETPTIPVLIGPLEKTFLFWRKLFDAGVFTNPVVPPAVPPSQCRLRTSLMATHTADQIDLALEVFGRLGKELGVI